MALRATLAWLCSVAALCLCAAQEETSLPDCRSHKQLLENLSRDLTVAAECDEALPSDWSVQQTAALLLHMRNLTHTLHTHQLKECQGAEPKMCPDAEVPDNGGLACVTVTNRRFCKPLCNHGYDFAFLRRSRLFDECSEATGHKWNSQYVGGNRLAVCNKAASRVSGASSAYFLTGQSCLEVSSSVQLTGDLIDTLVSELRNQGVEGEPQQTCLACGST